MKRNPFFVGLALGMAVMLVGCSSKSPTAPKQPTPSTYGISLTLSTPVAGINETITAMALVTVGGSPAPDGTSVIFSLAGNAYFLLIADPNQQVLTVTTNGGRASVAVVSLPGGGVVKVTASVPNQKDSKTLTFTGGSAVAAIFSVMPNRAPAMTAGTQVVIHGQALYLPQSVTFVVNGTNYPGQIVSYAADGTSITVSTPQAPVGDATITVALGAGGSVSAVGLFTFYDTSPSADKLPPVLYSVSPVTGSASGGEIITLTGAHFVNLTSVTFNFTDPTGVAKSLPAQIASKQLGSGGANDTAQVVVPRASINPVTQTIYVDLVLGSSVGSAQTYPRAFAYVPDVTTPPVIYYISPTFGSVQGHETVMIFGANFVQPLTVQIGAVNEIVQSVSSDGTSITIMTQPVSGTVPTVAQDVTVTTSLGVATLPAAFTYLEGQAPQLYALSPNNGPIEGGTRVTITGLGFQYPVQVLFGTQQAVVVSTNYDQVVCVSPSITASKPQTPTTVLVSVTNISSGKVSQNTLPFQYGQAMFISGISPTEGPATGGTTVTITGQGFVAPVSVIYAGRVQWSVLSVAGTQVVAKSAADSSAHICTGNSSTLVVTNLDSGLSATSPTFTYQAVRPLITSVVIDGSGNGVLQYQLPTCTKTWTSHTVTINGSGFSTAGVKVSFNGVGPVLATPTSATQITLKLPDLTGITILTTACMNGAQPGKVNIPTPVDVTVTNTDTGGTGVPCSDTLSAAIVINPCDSTTCQLVPTITTIAPPQGTMNGGTPVSIIGTNFSCPVTVLFAGASASGVACTATLLTMTSPAVSGGTAGPVTVTVVSGLPPFPTTGYTYTAYLNGTANPSGTGTFSGDGLQTNPTGTITAAVVGSATFASWTAGPCTTCSTNASCTVTMTTDPVNCTATFNPGLTVDLAGNIAANSVQSSPPGINACTSTCTASFTYNNVVTLTVSGVSTGVWSGACSGTGNSVVLMDGNKSCTVTFP